MTSSRHSFAYRLLVLAAMLGGVVGAQENSASQFRIAGTAVNKQDGTALDRVRVILRNVKDPKDVQSLLTGEDGHFAFRTGHGKYSLHGAKRGFISSDYDQHETFSTAIVTDAGVDTEDLQLEMAPSTVLSGRVLDEMGDPIRDATIVLWREDHMTGMTRISRFRQQNTDDLGTYEFTPLDAGTYYLSASASPWYAVHPPTLNAEGAPALSAAVDAGLDVVYPTTYYASAVDSESATPIAVEGGERLELDLRLTPVPALHVLFRAPTANKQDFMFPILQKRAFESFERPRDMQDAHMISPGVFGLTTAPGKYVLRLAGPGHAGRISDLDLTQDHQEIDGSASEPSSKVRASVQVLGESGMPRELFVALRDEKHRIATGNEVTSRGEVDLGEVAPGKYEVLAGSRGDSYAVIRIGLDGRETSGHSVQVSPGTAVSVTLTLVAGSAHVYGIVRRAGKPVGGAMVVLIPKHPANNIELFQRDQSNLDGSFNLRGVVAGSYTVTAIEDGWKLDWSRPEIISKYAVHGIDIVVPAEKGKEVQLPEAVEVQPR